MKKYIAILALVALISCDSRWLDVKSDKQLVVPSKLKDFQALMDNSRVMFTGMPVIGEISSDDYFVSENVLNALPQAWERNAYLWKVDVFDDASINGVTNDWAWPYQRIYYCNLVLEGLAKLEGLSGTDLQREEQIRGAALFHRGWAHYQLVQVFAAQYYEPTAGEILGIPIRLHTDISRKSTRSTLKETYVQIMQDLRHASSLLSEFGKTELRPSKAAAWALMAKISLSMGDYQEAMNYADSCLILNGKLMDYSSLDSTLIFPFAMNNEEVIYRNTLSSARIFTGAYHIDTTLLQLYNEGDLRKVLFFNKTQDRYVFTGSYEGSNALFGGLSSNEVYLIKAECEYRLGYVEEAQNTLVYLLKHRYTPEAWMKVMETEKTDIFGWILEERRKELVFRGIRWSDLKRLNQEGVFSYGLSREVNGIIYELPVNDPRWVLQIPPIVVEINEMEQNPR